MSNDSVMFQERETASGHRLGIATLNAPRKLNALDLGMIEQLSAQLLRWRGDPAVALVVLCGAGERAFCAGGDIRQVAEAARGHVEEEAAFAERYFPAEYRLDYLVHTFGKPVLVWGDGIVMGGGLGLMVGGSHRIVTPRSLLAMPEITIGLFPDVGASWFLNRMPCGSGLYLGLTGARINGADACLLGLADYLLPEQTLEALLESLAGEAWSAESRDNRERLSALLSPRHQGDAVAGQVQPRLEVIRTVTDHARTPELYEAILAGTHGDRWLEENAQRLEAGSPTSAWVIHAQLRRGRHQSLASSLRMEADMAVQFTRRHDFPEGVRALLVDKDNRPDWRPREVTAVDPEQVAMHFTSPWAGRRHPLADL